MAKLNTLVKTDVVQLGWPDLYEPKAFKDDKDKTDAEETKTDAADKKDEQSKGPKYRISVLLDKDNAEHMKTVRLLRVGQSNAMKNAVNDGTWAKVTKDSIGTKRALQDCDAYVQTYGVGKNAKQMVVADKYPERVNHWYLSASSRATRRPDVYYLSASGTFEKLPAPILDPQTDEERAEALRIEALWNKWVYAGQNARLGVSFYAWTTATGSGVSATVEAVFILGGGTRRGGYSFDEIFNADDLAEATSWLSEHAPSFDPDSQSNVSAAIDDDDLGDEETVDEETGEVVSEPSSDSEPEAAKTRKTARRRKTVKPAAAPEPEDEPAGGDEDIW